MKFSLNAFRTVEPLGLALGALLLTACGQSSFPPPTEASRNEFYFYINSDQDIFGTTEAGEIENQGELLAEQLKTAWGRGATAGLHIYLDRGQAIESGDNTNSEFYDSCAGKEHTETLGETDSEDPNYLKTLLSRSCQGETKKFVIFWSHGNGFRAQKDFDYSSSKPAFHIASLLDVIPQGFAEAVLFDSCSMASLEIASLLKGKTRYMVASQFELPSEGLQYFSAPQTGEVLDFLKAIRADSEATFRRMSLNAPLTLVDVTQLPDLEVAFRSTWLSSAAERSENLSSFRSRISRIQGDGDLFYLFEKNDGMSALKNALVDGRGSLSFALSESSDDSEFKLIQENFPTLFRNWSENFPNWNDYATASRPVQSSNHSPGHLATVPETVSNHPHKGTLL